MTVNNKRVWGYSLLFFLAIVFRLFIHYKTELIPGINGAYYLVQVRCLLTTGQLGFDDMPLYFYTLSGIVTLISFLSNWPIETISLHVAKVVDSVFLPLLVIPLYHIFRSFSSKPIPLAYELVIVAWALFSIGALLFIGDFQKNAFAIPFLFGLIWSMQRYLKDQNLIDLLIGISFFLLIGLSHFGVFAFSSLLMAVGLMLLKGKKGIIPLLILGMVSLGLVGIFDTSRFQRLLGLVVELFGHPALLLARPPEWIIYISSFLILYWSFPFTFKNMAHLSNENKILLQASWITMAILSFPFINGDYARRMILMLFIPQSFLLYYIFFFKPHQRRLLARISALLLVIQAIATIGFKQPSITSEAYSNLQQVEQIIGNKETTIIISRHGLEWWTNWSLGTKVGNVHAMDSTLLDNYETVLLLEEKEVKRPLNEKGPGLAFRSPKPTSGKLIERFNSEFFKVSEWQR